ncbi:MAG: saccharopine dehydrogenase [Rhodospirillales bacterium RIFCSPLOWO2_12_FULL_58_28]|nr:MAG: saccharopine dehydrogenase [Rhodospirillales bacterium RIFCSPLOWO2_02_FULL_58_16]OHC77730.1 MAG: saccharopine dehydrogenase [Rhodospirillales bacterium RIFCSPLOWO2_12_FULL_58_28]
MTDVLVLGAGKIGVSIAKMLADSRDYRVTLADSDAHALEARGRGDINQTVLDITDARALGKQVKAAHAVISALPFFLNEQVAEAAKAQETHYFDLTEDVRAARKITALAEGAKNVFVPQCGLAPGFISIVANHLVNSFDDPHDVRLRVGALPQFPDNMLQYNLTWSTDGLINEYCNPCEAIHESERCELLPLEGLEHFSLDGVDYEAFSTSGGIGTLCETLEGRVRNLTYKTVRYPGHRNMVQMLAGDLRMCENRDVFKGLIEHGIPVTRQDVVLIFVTVVGKRHGLLTQENYAKKIYGDAEETGMSAIQKTTAAGICAMVDLHHEGKLPASGFVRQENAGFKDFIANRFGKVYA